MQDEIQLQTFSTNNTSTSIQNQRFQTVVRRYLEQRKREKIQQTLSLEIQKLQDLSQTSKTSWFKRKKVFWAKKRKQGN